MKKFLFFLSFLAFAIAGVSQEIVTEYVATSTTAFGKYMKAPVQVYLADSAKTYLLTVDQDRFKTMSNVFALGASYYTQVTGGATAEAEIEALEDSTAVHRTAIDNLNDSTESHRTAIDNLNDSVTDHRTDIETNLAAILRLNQRAVHTPDTTYIYKYPLMAVVEYQPSTFPSDTGAHPRTVHLAYGHTLIPDNAIITEVIMDIYSDIDSDDDTATFKFMLETDGDLTIANIVADGSNEGVYRGWPGIYALDGAALSDTLMADSLATHYIKTTAAREILFWTDDTITAGIVRCFVKYVMSSEYSPP